MVRLRRAPFVVQFIASNSTESARAQTQILCAERSGEGRNWCLTESPPPHILREQIDANVPSSEERRTSHLRNLNRTFAVCSFNPGRIGFSSVRAWAEFG